MTVEHFVSPHVLYRLERQRGRAVRKAENPFLASWMRRTAGSESYANHFFFWQPIMPPIGTTVAKPFLSNVLITPCLMMAPSWIGRVVS